MARRAKEQGRARLAETRCEPRLCGAAFRTALSVLLF